MGESESVGLGRTDRHHSVDTPIACSVNIKMPQEIKDAKTRQLLFRWCIWSGFEMVYY